MTKLVKLTYRDFKIEGCIGYWRYSRMGCNSWTVQSWQTLKGIVHAIERREYAN